MSRSHIINTGIHESRDPQTVRVEVGVFFLHEHYQVGRLPSPFFPFRFISIREGNGKAFLSPALISCPHLPVSQRTLKSLDKAHPRVSSIQSMRPTSHVPSGSF